MIKYWMIFVSCVFAGIVLLQLRIVPIVDKSWDTRGSTQTKPVNLNRGKAYQSSLGAQQPHELQQSTKPRKSSKVQKPYNYSTSLLLPPLMEVLKQREQGQVDSQYDPLLDSYKSTFISLADSNSQDGETCSCRNATAPISCCNRNFYRMHKMGIALSGGFPFSERNGIQKINQAHRDEEWSRVNLTNPKNRHDYRDVFLFRPLYDALISGYLYHISGRECWLDTRGNPISKATIAKRWEKKGKHGKPPDTMTSVMMARYWEYHLHSFPADPPSNSRNMCQYLQDETEQDGMRIFIDFAFHHWYRRQWSRWALTRLFPEQAGERAHVICYDEVTSNQTCKVTVENAYSFLYNGTKSHKYNCRSRLEYTGGHSTSHDPKLRNRLHRIIDQLDEQIYNGDIAWLDRSLPC